MVGAEVFVALAPTLISNLADIYADEEDVTEQAPKTPDPEVENQEFERFLQEKLQKQPEQPEQNCYLQVPDEKVQNSYVPKRVI